MDKSEYQKLMNFINREDPKAFVTIDCCYNLYGFDFLGWNFRKYNEKLIMRPAFCTTWMAIIQACGCCWAT